MWGGKDTRLNLILFSLALPIFFCVRLFSRAFLENKTLQKTNFFICENNTNKRILQFRFQL